MHLSVKLIFTLAGQMTTTGEETHTPARRSALIGSHHLGITKSTCHPRGFSKRRTEAPAMGPTGQAQDLLKHFTLIVSLAC